MEEQQKNEHYLSVLVELQLYNTISAIKESDLQDKESEIEKAIQEFIEDLPPYLLEVPNVDIKVRRILEQTQINRAKSKNMQKDKEEDLGDER